MSSPPTFPVATAGTDFAKASAAVVDDLKATLPMGFWAVTRDDGERHLYLEVRDDAHGLVAMHHQRDLSTVARLARPPTKAGL